MRLASLVLLACIGCAQCAESRERPVVDQETPPSRRPNTRVEPPPANSWSVETVDTGIQFTGWVRLWSEPDRVVILYQNDLVDKIARRELARWTLTPVGHSPASVALDEEGRAWIAGSFGLEPTRLRTGLLAGDETTAVWSRTFSWTKMQLVIDRLGAHHLCFHEQVIDDEDGSAGTGQLFYATNRSGEWSNVAVPLDGWGRTACTLAVDKHGLVHLMATANDSAGTQGHYLQGNADGFREVLTVDLAEDRVLLAIDADDQVHLGYRVYLGGRHNVMTLGHASHKRAGRGVICA